MLQRIASSLTAGVRHQGRRAGSRFSGISKPSTMAAAGRAIAGAGPPPAGCRALFASSTPELAESAADDTMQTSHSKRVARALSGMESPEKDEVLTSKLTILFQTQDKPGALENALKMFWKRDVNMSRIDSRPSKGMSLNYDFTVDVEDMKVEDEKCQELLKDLEKECQSVQVMSPQTVPWFPMKASDLDSFSNLTLDAGSELESDHPGFNDEVYRSRREMIVDIAMNYRHGKPIANVEYSDDEVDTWGVVYDKLGQLLPRYACKQYNYIMPLLERNCGYARDNIPQLEDISQFLKEVTGFTLRPVGGLLSARDFLNALAFRVFYSTQYIRHHTKPLYTPEPDICHELLGHTPMFADPEFAEFSQEIGLASLGASDADIKRLATCYWFSVEFGLCYQQGDIKAYGAGLLSSFGELEYSCSPTRPAGGVDEMPEYRPWDPAKAAETEYPITTYQPIYYVAESFADAKERMRDFCENQINRPFHVRYDAFSQTVHVDRAVRRKEYYPVLQTG